MTDVQPRERIGEDRCWPCTVANSVVALVVALVPVAAAFVRGEPSLLALAVTWALLVLGYTLYRLLAQGYLPYAEPVARRLGLHNRIGQGSERKRGRR